MDPLARTLSTSKSFLSLNNHRRFIRCYIDSDCLNTSLPCLLLVIRRQFLDDDSDITVYYNVQDASPVYVAAI